MCGYVCFYRGKRWECFAPTLWEAKLMAIAHWGVVKAKHAYAVHVMLAEKGGKTVIHSGAEL